MSKDLYIKNIAHEAVEDDLRKLFSLCGKVTYIHMVKDPKTGVFLGCAYVKMATEAEAKDARVTIDGTRLYNREIVVEVALPQRTGRNAKPGVPPKGAPRPPLAAKDEAVAAPARKPRPAAPREEAFGKKPGGARPSGPAAKRSGPAQPRPKGPGGAGRGPGKGGARGGR